MIYLLLIVKSLGQSQAQPGLQSCTILTLEADVGTGSSKFTDTGKLIRDSGAPAQRRACARPESLGACFGFSSSVFVTFPPLRILLQSCLEWVQPVIHKEREAQG